MSLLVEMEVLPLEWVAKLKCVEGIEKRENVNAVGKKWRMQSTFFLKCAIWQDEREELIERVKGTQRGGNLKQRMRMGSWQ